MSFPFRSTPLALGVLCALQAGQALAYGDAPPVQFDTQTLQARGFSADVAAFFSHAPRFLPGVHAVTLRVNASHSQAAQVRFDEEGQLCFDAALAAQLKLRHDPAFEGCANAAAAWPGMSMRLFPGESAVALTLPEAAFDPDRDASAFHSGGFGALLNYDLFTQRVWSSWGRTDYLQATLEPGVNLASWAVRSRGVLTRNEGRSQYRQLEAFAQRPLDGMNALMQLGQVSVFGTGFGGVPLRGVQIGSDSAQTRAGQLVVPIQGVANSNATVEVSQQGMVVYRTVVQPGAFTLSGVQGLVSGADIEVQVIEEDGSRQRFSVAGGGSAGPFQEPTAWSVGAGTYDGSRSGQHGRTTAVVTGDYAFNPTPRLRVGAAGLWATDYQSVAAESSWAAANGVWTSARARYARTPGFGNGVELNLLGSANLGVGFSGSVSWMARSSGYVDPFSAIGTGSRVTDPSWFRTSAGASMAWAHARWGAFSYGLNHNSYYNAADNPGGGYSHTFAYGNKAGPGRLNLTLQKQPGMDVGAFVNYSVPLARGTWRSTVSQAAGREPYGSTSYDGRLGHNKRYSLGISGSEKTQRFSASTSMNTAYAQVGAGASHSSRGSDSAYFSATGALVYADGLLGTASRKVSDTFAIVQIPGQSGVRVTSPGGTSVTNFVGAAVIPSVPPYAKTELRIDTRSVPLNTRLGTTTLDLELTRGSVATRRISVTRMRQLLLRVSDAEGKPVPLGASVYDESGAVIGIMASDGNLMLVNDDIGRPIRLGGAHACTIAYEAPKRFDAESAYEEAEATCI